MRAFINRMYDRFVTMIGDIKVYKFPFFMVYDPSEYHVTGEDMHNVLDLVKPGDVLLRGFTYYLDGKFIPGAFSHAAFYAGENQVIHATAEGVHEENLLSFLRCDVIAVLRITDLTPADRLAAVMKAYSLLGRPYDFRFVAGNDAYYCSELVSVIYGHMPNLGVAPEPISLLFGLIKKLAITPVAFLKSSALQTIYLNEMAKKRLSGAVKVT